RPARSSFVFVAFDLRVLAQYARDVGACFGALPSIKSRVTKDISRVARRVARDTPLITRLQVRCVRRGCNSLLRERTGGARTRARISRTFMRVDEFSEVRYLHVQIDEPALACARVSAMNHECDP